MRSDTTKIVIAAISCLFIAQAGGAHAASLGFAGARPLFWGGVSELLDHFGESSRIVVSSTAGGCSEAVNGLRSGEIEIGGICCLVDESLSEFEAHPIAMDAITIIVHPSNPVSGLTMDQLRGVFHGDISDWAQAGGAKGPITPVFRNHCDYKNEIFKREVIISPDLLAPSALVVDTIAKTMDYVIKYPQAISHVSSVFSAGSPSFKVIPIDGVLPTSENISSGRYPLSRVLSVITRKNPPREVTRFIRHLKSREGQAILSKRLAPLPARR